MWQRLRDGLRKASAPALVVDEQGVRRTVGVDREEAVGWDEIEQISIVTTDEGPWLEDFYWLLHGANGRGCAVPGALAQEHGLLELLQERFAEGFDNEAVIRACGSCDHAMFVVWPVPEGPSQAKAG
jgi:hypothetical protein